MRFRLAMTVFAVVALCTGASFGAIGWANYQWPCNGAGYADNEAINVYSQSWKDGCTPIPGPCADLSVDIFYKRASEGTYTQAPMIYLGDAWGANDEYTYTILPGETVAGDDMQYYFVWHDASDMTDYNPVDHCGGGVVDGPNNPLTLHITPATSIDVTVHFSVDMNCLGLDLYSAGVFFAGDFVGWSACTFSMTDGDNDGIYDGTWLFPAGSNPYHEYKHNRSGSDGCQWEGIPGNRTFIIDESGPDMYLPTVKWDNWDCCPLDGPAVIDAAGSYCLQLCLCDRPLSIQIVSPYGNTPVLVGVSFAEGCDASMTNCDYTCVAGAGTVGWGIREGTDGLYYLDLCLNEGGIPGCFCMTIDQILPVEFGSFAAVAGNGVITLNWNTLSETDNNRFEIERDGQLAAQVASLGNTSSGHSYSWVDRDVVNGTSYSYTLFAVDVNGSRAELATTNAVAGGAVASEYALHGNYPNPFNPSTTISYSLANAGNVNLMVYDLTGRVVATLVNESQEAGNHTTSFAGANLPSGLYYYRLTSGSFTATAKMVLMK